MMIGSIKKKVFQNLINIPGWRTTRKIIVFESDDWGALRMPSKSVYNKLLTKGIAVEKSYYNQNDSLESNNDLDALFSVLKKFKDKNNNPAVFTALSIVANPDFDKIRSNDFTAYEFESVKETLKRYGTSHNNVINLWHEGINEGVFYPEFHGREHLNVNRWMNILTDQESITRKCFDHNFYGIGQEKGVNYLPAFDFDNEIELDDQKIILKEGISLFRQVFSYQPRFFIAPNFLLSTKLESFLKANGIDILSGARQQKEPLGNDQYKKNFRFTGKENKHGQLFVARNSLFEHGHNAYKFGWQQTLKDIETAFFWHKPAIISTHRVNYIGNINQENRRKGLEQLEELLKNIVKKWPNVEFMNTTQLAEVIRNS